jgi:hypothetical protein
MAPNYDPEELVAYNGGEKMTLRNAVHRYRTEKDSLAADQIVELHRDGQGSLGIIDHFELTNLLLEPAYKPPTDTDAGT